MTVTIASCGEEVFLSGQQAQIVRQRLAMVLLMLYKEGYTDFYVNSSVGIPMWAAQLVIRMRQRLPVRLHLMCPHEEQAAHWPDAQRELYFDIHSQADTVEFAARPTDSGSYRIADRQMLESSDMLLYYPRQGEVMYPEEDLEAFVLDMARDREMRVEYL